MDRTALLNKVAAAMQDEIGATNDPTGDYDIAISSAAVVAVDVLGADLDAARARAAEVEKAGDAVYRALEGPDAPQLSQRAVAAFYVLRRTLDAAPEPDRSAIASAWANGDPCPQR